MWTPTKLPLRARCPFKTSLLPSMCVPARDARCTLEATGRLLPPGRRRPIAGCESSSFRARLSFIHKCCVTTTTSARAEPWGPLGAAACSPQFCSRWQRGRVIPLPRLRCSLSEDELIEKKENKICHTCFFSHLAFTLYD